MSAILLEARGVSKHFGGGRRWLGVPQPAVQAVRGVDLALERGAAVGLVGESGCGKSTLGRLMGGLAAPDAGEVRLEGRALTGFTRGDWRRFRRRVQVVFQDPLSSLNPRRTVRRLLATPMQALLGLSGAELETRLAELLERVGLAPDTLARYPHEFSGGQAQRIAIARALAPRPEVLILDEPVSALDVSVQAQILALLAGLRRDLGLTYLFISHDLAVVERLCDQVAVMYLGRVIEQGARPVLFGAPHHPYTRLLLASVPVPGRTNPAAIPIRGEPPSAAQRPPGCPFAPRCYRAEARCRRTEPPLASDAAGHPVACFFAADSDWRDGNRATAGPT